MGGYILIFFKGEFTQRGYSNGKISYLDIEDISSIIEAENEIEKKFYEHGNSKNIKKFTNKLRKKLITVSAILEAHLDFEELEVKNDLDNYRVISIN